LYTTLAKQQLKHKTRTAFV